MGPPRRLSPAPGRVDGQLPGRPDCRRSSSSRSPAGVHLDQSLDVPSRARSAGHPRQAGANLLALVRAQLARWPTSPRVRSSQTRPVHDPHPAGTFLGSRMIRRRGSSSQSARSSEATSLAGSSKSGTLLASSLGEGWSSSRRVRTLGLVVNQGGYEWSNVGSSVRVEASTRSVDWCEFSPTVRTTKQRVRLSMRTNSPTPGLPPEPRRHRRHSPYRSSRNTAPPTCASSTV